VPVGRPTTTGALWTADTPPGRRTARVHASLWTGVPLAPRTGTLVGPSATAGTVSRGSVLVSKSPPVSPGPPTVSSRRRATRAGRPSWLDARLATGVLLVVVAVGGGAATIASADRSTEVWGVRTGLVAGSRIGAGDLESRSVRFVSGDLADRYLAASADPPAGSVVLRAVGAGELLPRDAVAATPPTARVELPLSVAAGDLPPSLRAGAAVDVWAAPGENRSAAGQGTDRAVRVLAAVPLQSLVTASGLGASGRSTATVLLDREGVDLSTALAQLAGRRIVLVPVTGLPATTRPAPPRPAAPGPSAPGPSAHGPSATPSPAAPGPSAPTQDPAAPSSTRPTSPQPTP